MSNCTYSYFEENGNEVFGEHIFENSTCVNCGEKEEKIEDIVTKDAVNNDNQDNV